MCGEGDRNICARDKHIYENISYHGVHFVLLKSEETTAGGRYLHVFKKWGGTDRTWEICTFSSFTEDSFEMLSVEKWRPKKQGENAETF